MPSLLHVVCAQVTVGPASGLLKDVPPEQWKAKDVALTVLIDRCATVELWRCGSCSALLTPVWRLAFSGELNNIWLTSCELYSVPSAPHPSLPLATFPPLVRDTFVFTARIFACFDRSTSRMSTGQRFALNDVEEAHEEVRGEGQLFWVYEHRSQVGEGSLCGIAFLDPTASYCGLACMFLFVC